MVIEEDRGGVREASARPPGENSMSEESTEIQFSVEHCADHPLPLRECNNTTTCDQHIVLLNDLAEVPLEQLHCDPAVRADDAACATQLMRKRAARLLRCARACMRACVRARARVHECLHMLDQILAASSGVR